MFCKKISGGGEGAENLHISRFSFFLQVVWRNKHNCLFITITVLYFNYLVDLKST